MRSLKTLSTTFGLITMLVACGGGDGDIFAIRDAPNGPIAASEAERIADAYTLQSTRVLDSDYTDDLGMPDEGQAVFDGRAALVITPRSGTEAYTFVGDATVRADFSQNHVFAQMDGFAGKAMTGRNLRLDGEIVMSDARIGDGSPSNISGLYRGALMGEGVSIETDGVLIGKFHETPVAAVSLAGSDASASYNDAAAGATLTVVAE